MRQLLLCIALCVHLVKAGQFHEIECLEQKIIPIDTKNEHLWKKLIASSNTLSDLTQFASTNESDTKTNSLSIPYNEETVSFFLDHADKLEKKKTAGEVFNNLPLPKTFSLLSVADFLHHEIAQITLEKKIAARSTPSNLPEKWIKLNDYIPNSLGLGANKKCARCILMHNLPSFASIWQKKKVALQSVDPKPEWVTQKLEQSEKMRDELIKDRKILQKNKDWYRYDALPDNKALVFGSIYGDAISFEKKENQPEYQVLVKEQHASLNDLCFRDAQTILMALDGKVIKWKPAHTKERILFQSKNELVDRLTIHREKNIAATFHSELLSSARHVVLWQAKPWRMLSRIEINKLEGHAFELIFNDNCNQLYISVKGSNNYSHLVVDFTDQIAAHSSFEQFLPNASLKDAFLLLYGSKSLTPGQLLINDQQLAKDVSQAHQLVKDFYQIQQEPGFLYKAWLGLYNAFAYLFSSYN